VAVDDAMRVAKLVSFDDRVELGEYAEPEYAALPVEWPHIR
jgi:hypothetical protein